MRFHFALGPANYVAGPNHHEYFRACYFFLRQMYHNYCSGEIKLAVHGEKID